MGEYYEKKYYNLSFYIDVFDDVFLQQKNTVSPSESSAIYVISAPKKVILNSVSGSVNLFYDSIKKEHHGKICRDAFSLSTLSAV